MGIMGGMADSSTDTRRISTEERKKGRNKRSLPFSRSPLLRNYSGQGYRPHADDASGDSVFAHSVVFARAPHDCHPEFPTVFGGKSGQKRRVRGSAHNNRRHPERSASARKR